MEDLSYQYLFPFEKVPIHSRILIYGAGALGQEYLKQVMLTGYCKVIGFVDRNFSTYPSFVIPCYAPQKIGSIQFDYIVIALRSEFALPEILRILGEQDVKRESIVYIGGRKDVPQTVFQNIETKRRIIPAYRTARVSIAFYLSGGIGDMICQKRFILEIIRSIPHAGIDLYAVQNLGFMKWLYSDCENIRGIVSDSGVLYKEFCENYSLCISIFGCHFLQVDCLQKSHFERNNKDFLSRILKLRQKAADERLNLAIPHAISLWRRIYKGEKCYSWFGYRDVFPIVDFRVSIPVDMKYHSIIRNMRLHNYITINIGNGSSNGNAYIAKTWPPERFGETVMLIKNKYPALKVVQLGATDGVELDEVDVHFMGKGFGQVACILKSAIFHLDIEGGLVHMASQLGTKCIVLFGPTPVEYYAYQANVNIVAGTCHGCYGLYSQTDRCARHMEKPECMYSITPEIVMEEIDKYMSTLESGGREENIRV